MHPQFFIFLSTCIVAIVVMRVSKKKECCSVNRTDDAKTDNHIPTTSEKDHDAPANGGDKKICNESPRICAVREMPYCRDNVDYFYRHFEVSIHLAGGPYTLYDIICARNPAAWIEIENLHSDVLFRQTPIVVAKVRYGYLFHMETMWMFSSMLEHGVGYNNVVPQVRTEMVSLMVSFPPDMTHKELARYAIQTFFAAMNIILQE